MCKWYKEMDCYILMPQQSEPKYTTDKIAQRAQLETSFRNYAAVFDKVKIVIDNSQEKEHFLNFPYVCHSQKSDTELNLSTLISDATSDAIFIGHGDLVDFPISILADLLKAYNGEMFMGYKSAKQNPHQVQFGIYHKSLVSKISKGKTDTSLEAVESEAYKLLPLPKSAEAFL